MVLILVLGAGSGCGAGLDARAIQGGLLGAASGALIGAGAGGGSGALIGAGAGAIGGTIIGAQMGRCEDDPSQCQQAQVVHYRGGQSWGHRYPHPGRYYGGGRHYYPSHGYPGRGYGYGGGRHHYQRYGNYGYGGSCNYRCEQWDARCQWARGQCEGLRRASEERARDAYNDARERAYCAGGGRNCRPPR